MKCPYCGKEVEEGSKFCDGCGAKLTETASKSDEAVYYQPPKNSKAGVIAAIIIISILLITGIIIGIILLTNGKDKNSKKENEKEYTEKDKKEDKKTKASIEKIKYTKTVLDSGDIVIVVKNNNNVEASVDFTVVFSDENGTIVERKNGTVHGVPADSETVLKIYRSSRDYTEFEVEAEVVEDSYYVSNIKDVKITSVDNKEDREISVTFNNNSKNKLDYATVAAVFYKDGKIIGFNYDSEYDIDVNQSIAMYISYPYDKSYNTLEFDDYKVYVTEASSYSFNY